MRKEKKAGKSRITKQELRKMVAEYLTERGGEPCKEKSIWRDLSLKTTPEKMLLNDVLEELEDEEFIIRTSRGAWQLRRWEAQTMEGTFIRRANGRNSFRPDGEDKTLLVTERNSLYAMNGDRVRVSVMARRRGHTKEAQVTDIIERATDKFVGRLRVEEDVAFLAPQDDLIPFDIIIPKNKTMGGRTDDKAVVRIVQWADDRHKVMTGEVIDVLGAAGDNTVEMHAILAQYGLPYTYPKEVEEEADKITGEITPEDYAEREDYRNVFTCTIDPADAKDFDDALSIRPTTDPHVWEVGVHIADVSHYVLENSIIDREARERATSVYLVDRTIPMLPERLCNFVCSLRPDEEKLTYSVIFNMNERAEVLNYRIRHTVIKSNRRFAYEEVQQILEASGATGDGPVNPAGEYAPELCRLWALAKILREKRFANGSVKFESEEMKFILDDEGHPTGCYFKKLLEANNLVEEFMLLANKTVAEHVGKVKRGQKAKTLPYRIHEDPDAQKLDALREFIVKFGYKMRSTSTKGETARQLNRLMEDCEGRREQKLIQSVALRAMMKAKYSVHNIGHFGLAFDYYTHFTSPIRRYPDTMVHRLLTRYEQGAPSANKEYYEELCRHSSDMEVIAANAERDSIKYKAAEFMQDKIGQTFLAHISGITSYGIYCEIDDNHCEGLVAMRDLKDDFYEYDDKNYRLRGRRHGTIYQLGDPLTIRVKGSNPDKKQISFVLA
ncbi:MAG: ribonuclease R [Prevotella sp.]|nr:ribonuclease R [Prevotella sp.]